MNDHQQQHIANDGLPPARQRLWRLLIWLLGIATPLTASLRPRVFSDNADDFILTTINKGQNQFTHAITLLNAAALICMGLAIIVYLGQRSSRSNKQTKKLFFAGLMFACTPFISAFAVDNKIKPGMLSMAFVFIAAYLLPRPEIKWWTREVRKMLLIVFVYGSIVAVLFFTNWALQKNYAEEYENALLPIRLFGSATHANSLAPIALFTWLLGDFPGCRLRFEKLHRFFIFLLILLSQSKTTWIISVILVLMSMYRRFKRMNFSGKLRAVAFGSAALTAVAAYLVAYTSFMKALAEKLSDPQIFTLTGRLFIWIYSYELWLKKPWFGHGPDAWSPDAVFDRVRSLGWAVPNAHNQVLQTLTESGIVGLVVLLCFYYMIFSIFRNQRKEYSIPAINLLIVVSLMSITEVVVLYRIGAEQFTEVWIVFVMGLILAKTGNHKRKHC